MLNDRQRRFVAEYLVDLNATQAAVRAGYSARTANRPATRLLRNVRSPPRSPRRRRRAAAGPR